MPTRKKTSRWAIASYALVLVALVAALGGCSDDGPTAVAQQNVTNPSGSIVLSSLRDSDGDGTIDLLDSDDDNDGLNDDIDIDDDNDGIMDTDELDSDGDGVIDDHDDDNVEIKGEIMLVSDDHVIVFSTQVFVDDNTWIKGHGDSILGFGDLQSGMWVEIEGILNDDGTVLATKIEIEDEDSDSDDMDDDFEFYGTIDSVGTDALTVSGRTVHVDSTTTIMGRDHTNQMFLSMDDLETGMRVEVEGHLLDDDSVQAKKIKIEEQSTSDPPPAVSSRRPSPGR